MPSKRSAFPPSPPARAEDRAPGAEQNYAQLLEQARAEAAATTAQLRAMQALTDTALSHLALDDLLRELLDRVTAVMGVDHAAILLLDEDGRTLTVRAARGLLEEDVGRVRVAVGRGFPGRVAARRAPLIADTDELSDADFEGASPIVGERLHSLAGVPLLVVDRAAAGQAASGWLVGVLGVGSTAPHRFAEVDVQLLQLVGDRVALAVDRARLYAAEQVARRRAEAEAARAQESEAQATERAERLNTILETIADGVAVVDTDGRLLVVNRAYREQLALEHAPAGYEASLPGRERFRLVQVCDAATGAPLAFAESPLGRAVRGEVVKGPGADIRVRAFDGRELEVNASAAPLRDQHGRIVGAVGVLHDMTERNQLAREREAARVQAERQADELDRAFAAAADGLLVYDAAGRLVRANPAAHRILGLDAAPPGYDQLPLLERMALYATRDEQDQPLPPEEWPVLLVLRAEGRAGSGPRTRDLRVHTLDGREIEVAIRAAPLWDREGHLVGAVNVMHDVTERNRLAHERAAARADELAARETSRRLEEFMATAAHDLRAPLTAVVGYLALAQRQTDKLAAAAQEASPALAPQVAAVRGRLEEADSGTERLTRLLTLLFDTAALRAGKLELHRAPHELAALVQEQVAAQRTATPERTIRLRTPAGSKPIPVEADADRIGQVLTNYVTNALKYSPPDQPVDVAVAARGGWAHVTVRDQGPGLPKAEQARVWELLHRASGIEVQSRTRSGAGEGSLGLGLHIAKAIITAHGGRVGVSSAVGKGSTFWFTLPLFPLSGPLPAPIDVTRHAC